MPRENLFLMLLAQVRTTLRSVTCCESTNNNSRYYVFEIKIIDFKLSNLIQEQLSWKPKFSTPDCERGKIGLALLLICLREAFTNQTFYGTFERMVICSNYVDIRGTGQSLSKLSFFRPFNYKKRSYAS